MTPPQRITKVFGYAIIMSLLFNALSFQFLPFFHDNPAVTGNDAAVLDGDGQHVPIASAGSPFAPSITFGSQGSNLLVVDTFNGTIQDQPLLFQAGFNSTVPIIAPPNISHIPIVPAANISKVSVKLNPVTVPPVIIPWNNSVSRENKSMDGQTVAQTFNIANYSTITNFSFFGKSFGHIISDLYDVHIKIVRGLPTSTNIVTQEDWSALNFSLPYAFPNSGPKWYDFDLPDNQTNPGIHSVIVNLVRMALAGEVDFFIVNDTDNPAEGGYNYTSPVWAPISAGDFSIKVGVESSSQKLLGTAMIKARMGSGAWKNFSKITHDVVLGVAEGAPWAPGSRLYGPILYYGVPLILQSNESMEINATIDITYRKQGHLVQTACTFRLDLASITWNATYNASLPSWNELIINRTVYTMHALPATQSFTIDVPHRWTSINITQPDVRSIGDVNAITIDNASSYLQKIWRFVASSPWMVFSVALNGTTFSSGDAIHVSGTMVDLYAATYTGNASFWLDRTTEHQNVMGTFFGTSFSFPSNLAVPNDTVAPSGYYACLVLLTNGTDVGYNVSTVQIRYAANAYLAGNKALHDIEGPHAGTITARVALEINKTGSGIPGATPASSWGTQGVAWWYEEAATPGEYLFHFNTSIVYCKPGGSNSTTITFTRADMYPAMLVLCVHPWIATSLQVSIANTTIHVNQTMPVCINYTDIAGTNLSVHGLEHLNVTYSLNASGPAQLGFAVLPSATWTCVLDLNSTNIPATRKAGNYTFGLGIQAKLDNGTWYQPRNFVTGIEIEPLLLSWNVVRLDTTFNETLSSMAVAEFEGLDVPVAAWLRVTKEEFITEQTTRVVNASKLQVHIGFDNQSFMLDESPGNPGLYQGLINFSSIAAPRLVDATVSLAGRDIATSYFTIHVNVIKRYVLEAAIDGWPEQIIEDRLLDLNITLTFIDRNNETHPYALKNVTVYVTVSDGSIQIPTSFTIMTDSMGRFTITGIVIPKIIGTASISIRVEPFNDKAIDPGIPCVVNVPIVQDFGSRYSLTIVIVIIAIAISIVLFVKEGIPRVKAHQEEKKIAIIKAKQDAGHPGKVRLETDAEQDVTDTGELAATSGLAFMHMGPPEIIDIDLSRKPRRARQATASGSTAAPAPQAVPAPKSEMKATEPVDEKFTAIAKAADLEAKGDLAGAIEQYEIAIERARKDNLDDEVFVFIEKIDELKKEMAKK